ncbi:TRAP transporter small permease [Propionivibrio limicola]|uniref:TRAP transporter small permease n=1 Tax=Propionivibrio limicola TaxID=167645 RepID=UPI00147914F8|nr:TRAP transporter small permease [Propionivibrio limicola]
MFKQLKRIAEFIGTASYGILFLTFIFQVILRFVFNKPLTWSDELIVILYVFSMFWAGAFLLKEKDHVMLDLIYEHLPPQGKRVFSVAYSLAIGGLFLWAVPASYSYVSFMMREKTPVLDVPFGLVFAPFILFLLAIGLLYLRKLIVLFGPTWQTEVGVPTHDEHNAESVE